MKGKKEQRYLNTLIPNDVDQTLLERGEEDVLEAKENALERNN